MLFAEGNPSSFYIPLEPLFVDAMLRTECERLRQYWVKIVPEPLFVPIGYPPPMR
jgi:hypothetical protein